ncbi:MAG TPA: hypothetical protein VEV38_05430 [Candidatus Eremiobacteraceae bacterium]|nr:hypothetical protein [Candidatus Eremiobacteraceae bacterium]
MLASPAATVQGKFLAITGYQYSYPLRGVAVGISSPGLPLAASYEFANGWSTIATVLPAGATAGEFESVFEDFNATVIAVGWSYGAGGYKPLIERLSGSSSSVLPNPSFLRHATSLQSISGVPTEVGRYWIAGASVAGFFDGATWHDHSAFAHDSGYHVELTGIAVRGDNDVWIVGAEKHFPTTKPLIEHWNGKSWSLVADLGTESELVGVFADTHGVWAVGRSASGAPFAERSDGSKWSAPQLPASILAMQGEFTSASRWFYSGSTWVSGWYTAPGSSNAKLPLVVHLKRSLDQWTIIDTTATSYLDSLGGVFIGMDSLGFAVGYQTSDGIDDGGPTVTYPYALELYCE